jgi:hypothetical protein
VTSKSSAKSSYQLLGIPPAKSEKLLSEIANCRGDDPACRRFFALYPELFDSIPDDEQRVAFVIWVRDLLQRAWDASEHWHREWFIQEIEAQYHTGRESSLLDKIGPSRAEEIQTMTGYTVDKGEVYFHLRTVEPPEKPVPLVAIMYHFRMNTHRLRHCPNPLCTTPYFFATKKGQKFCSAPCALPAQREAKRRWWNENRAGISKR